MLPKGARRALLIAAINLGIIVALLGAIELFCRHVEHARVAHAPDEKPWRPVLPPKSGSELRVLVFGASTVYGFPAPEVGFVAQIQYWLRRLYPDRNIRIYNLGWGGIDTSFVLQDLSSRFADQPDMVIVITGGNEFVAPVSGKRTASIREGLSSHFAMMRLLQERVSRIAKSRKSYVMPSQVLTWDRASPAYKSRIADLERSLSLIVERARQRGVPLIVGTIPSNFLDWPPVYKRVAGRGQSYLDLVSGIQKLLQDGKYPEASDAVTTGFGLYGEDAMLYFLRGRIQYALGAYADARMSLVKARDLDPVLWRPTSQINSIIRRAATGAAGVALADLERAYEEHSENGLVGFNLMADYVHSTPLGESIIAQTIIQKMTEIGFLPGPRPAEGECCPVATFLANVGYFQPKSPLRLHSFLWLARTAMKPPFLDFERSRDYLLEAMKVDENSWEVWANLATISYLAGDISTGTEQLQRATALHKGPIDASDRRTTPYLQEGLEYSARQAGSHETGAKPR